MKTVGEFKKAGLEFVKGDVVDDSHDNDGTFMKTLSARMAVCCNEGKYQFNEASIESFAWRENTGVKPEFLGLVDVEFTNGQTMTSYKIDLIPFTLNTVLPVAKWRPSLNQSSVTEHDTKESAIHKAWVDLKGDWNKRSLKSVWDEFLYSNNGNYIALSSLRLIGDWQYICTRKEFTDYCKKMAAEEKRMDIIGQNGNDGLHYVNTAQQVEVIVNNNTPFSIELAEKGGFSWEIKAANDKPIFTQAMADANELPPVGSECILNLAFDSYPAKVTYIGSGVGCFINLKNGEEYSFAMKDTSFKTLDTRTDRERAIDEMMTTFYCIDDELPLHVMCDMLYNAGYRKC